jgi:hypothetical protein
MPTKNTLPTLEEILSAEKIEAMKAEISETACTSYQPLLENLCLRFGPVAEAKITAQVELVLVEEGRKPVLRNNLSLGIAFTPEKAFDMFEEVNRTIIREMFASLLKK